MDIQAGGRRPFVTNKGFVRLYSTDMKGGNLALILLGLRVLMVLRPFRNGKI
jgi:hypothetical protein